jgi:phosphoribosylamine--glycine ligase
MQLRIMKEIVDPVVAGLRRDGSAYCGFLYAGLMLTCAGPKVIEFNVRFGDPEAQVVIPMIAEDLAPRLAAAADGALDDRPLAFRPEPHVGVVLASPGYPAAGPVGMPITGLDAAARLDDVFVFHAGTARQGTAIVTAGGRVLTVVGRGASFADAIARAYEGVSKIAFDGMHYRTDIGRKALEH